MPCCPQTTSKISENLANRRALRKARSLGLQLRRCATEGFRLSALRLLPIRLAVRSIPRFVEANLTLRHWPTRTTVQISGAFVIALLVGCGGGATGSTDAGCVDSKTGQPVNCGAPFSIPAQVYEERGGTISSTTTTTATSGVSSLTQLQMALDHMRGKLFGICYANAVAGGSVDSVPGVAEKMIRLRTQVHSLIQRAEQAGGINVRLPNGKTVRQVFIHMAGTAQGNHCAPLIARDLQAALNQP